MSKNHAKVLLLSFLAAGCSAAGLVARAPTDLLIDLSIMPPGWYVVPAEEPPDDYRQQSGAEIWFNVNDPHVLHVAAHRLYQYRSERQAEEEFERQLPIQFNSTSIASLTPWMPPPELPYKSSVANQFHFACHVSSITQVITICQAMGQYDRYLMVFHTRVQPDHMSYDDIESILLEIDTRMKDHLDNHDQQGN